MKAAGPIISLRHEEILAYLSSYAPLGTEFVININHLAKDLRYLDQRGLYQAIGRLRDIGAVTLVPCKRHWDRTTLICHMRPEHCVVKLPRRADLVPPLLGPVNQGAVIRREAA